MSNDIFNKNMVINKFEEPYPHVVIENFLDGQFFEEIKSSLPNWEQFPQKLRRGGRKDISNYHYGNSGLINSIFKQNPKLELLYLMMNSEQFRVSMLKMFNIDYVCQNDQLKVPITFDVAMARDSYINVPHVDGDFHLVSGLFYFGNEEIKSGGNILLHHPPKDGDVAPKYQSDQVEVGKKVSPQSNTLVFWENSSLSIHSTDELVGDRRFLYFSIDCEEAPSFSRPWDVKKNIYKVEPGSRRSYQGLDIINRLRRLRKKNRFQ